MRESSGRLIGLVFLGGIALAALGYAIFGPKPATAVSGDRIVLNYWEKWTGSEAAAMQQVVDAFNDVSSARGDRETLALAAESYASRTLPEVRGSAGARVSQAKAQGTQRTAQARGDIARFEALLVEERAASQATRMRLWSATAAKVGATVKVHALAGQTEVFLSESP